MAAQRPHDNTVTLEPFTVRFSQALLYYILHKHASSVEAIFMYNTKKKPALRILSAAFALMTKLGTSLTINIPTIHTGKDLQTREHMWEEQLQSFLTLAPSGCA